MPPRVGRAESDMRMKMNEWPERILATGAPMAARAGRRSHFVELEHVTTGIVEQFFRDRAIAQQFGGPSRRAEAAKWANQPARALFR